MAVSAAFAEKVMDILEATVELRVGCMACNCDEAGGITAPQWRPWEEHRRAPSFLVRLWCCAGPVVSLTLP